MLLAAVMALTACSSGHRAATTSTTTLLQTDSWTAPVVSGPPSSASFCTVLTAMYRHEAQLPEASTKTKEQIVRDFLASVPTAIAQAPAPIAAPARTYLDAVAQILQSLLQAGLNYHNVQAGSLAGVLLDPSIKTAGNQVLDYSQNQCHYSIGG